MVHPRSDVRDISPALSQPFTPVSGMADSYETKSQQQTVPTRRSFIILAAVPTLTREVTC